MSNIRVSIRCNIFCFWNRRRIFNNTFDFHSFLNVTGPLAVASSIGQIPFTALSGIIKYAKKNKVNFKYAFLLSLGSIPTSQFLANILANSENNILGKINVYKNLTLGDFLIIFTFIIVVGGTGIYNILKSNKNITNNNFRILKCHKIYTLIVGALFGFFSVLLGIGGGFLSTPYFIYYCRFTSIEAVATTLTVLFITSTITTIYYLLEKQIYFLISLIIAIGGIIGAQLGSSLALKLSQEKILLYLGYLQILAVIFYIISKI
ncbi:MAG: hypothetical protein KatS3mg068_1482 [Candidatus Sericytochromatia bacterium]|nr:MAG: hypothetical protein KatS3mg068_1482 [Candidatus Sericytochromatia bacterium]